MRTVRQAYTAFMLLLAKATDRELARVVSYLKEENRILRDRLPERINVTPKVRQRLLRFGGSLGITPPSRNTVRNILKAAGLEPSPKRGDGTWDEFLARHAKTLVQCDFLNRRVWTAKGLRDVFVLVFLHVETRRAYITPATYNPGEAWIRAQTETFLGHAKEEKLQVTMLFHDRDTKFTAAVDRDLAKRGIDVRKTAFRAPNTNAFVERFIQSIQQECLDHFLIFGTKHFDHLVAEWLEHYHEERPHQAKENEVLVLPKSARDGRTKCRNGDKCQPEGIACRERLGGLLKHYYGKAA